MISNDLSEQEKFDLAMDGITAWSISIPENVAIAIASWCVANERRPEDLASNVLTAWGEQQLLAFQLAEKKISEADASAGASRLKKKERSAMTPTLRLAVLQRDAHRCKSCGSGPESDKLHIDHVVPISLGGKTQLDNLQVLCRACNLAKSARLIAIPSAE